MRKLNKLKPVPMWQQTLWWLIRAALLVFAIHGLFIGSVTEFLMGMFSIAFSHLWDMFQLFGGKSFITRVGFFSQTLLNILLFFGCIVGPTLNAKTHFEYANVIEHFWAGLIATNFGYDLAVTMQGQKRHLSPALASLFSLMFSIMIGVAWEFYEFTMDRLYGYHLQRSNLLSEEGLVDTMIDLIVCGVGSVIGMFLIAFRRTGIIGPNRKAIRAKVKARSKQDRKEELEFLGIADE
ncbi:MAG TPA: hypothetical protein GXZ23_04730 [Clostridiales bacterium]|mgnify:CR=1 FL=1|jgi:hypothetical protein|nr:hypothetical protein [Clostridiales bacterium]